jgi:hypothetical protein
LFAINGRFFERGSSYLINQATIPGEGIIYVAYDDVQQEEMHVVIAETIYICTAIIGALELVTGKFRDTMH